MHISELSVKRPVFAAVLSLLLMVVGYLSFRQLPVREYPDIDPPIVSVETNYPGASAAVVDTKITQLLEDRISGIEGIRSITSTSEDGKSEITIEFELSREIDSAANDVRERVGRAVDNLPVESDPPEIFKVDSGGDVIMWLNLASDNLNGLELTDYADRYLVDRLATVSGVARVRIGGAREYSLRVWLDRDAMAARGITVADIEGALRSENVELPAGRVDSADRYFTVRTQRGYETEEDFAKLVVGQGSDGHLIRLGEVADAQIGAVEHRQELRGNGQDMVGLGIIPQSTANTLEVAQAVMVEVTSIQESLPEGTRIFNSFDSTVFIDQSINEIYNSLIIALILVVLVIFAFLGSVRAVLVPAVTVPISLIGALIFLRVMGYSLNLLTLLALLLAIGLVVDDAIVVLENIYRRIHLGESPALASVRGAKQVSFAVIATTLVLIAVFVPIGFLSGNTGRLFSEFAFALAAAVGVSSLIALTLSPMMCSFLLSSGQTEGRFAKLVDTVLDGAASRYRRMLDVALGHPFLVGSIIVLAAGLMLFCFRRLPAEFAPKEDRGVFFIMMNAPEGSSYEYAQKYMREIETELLPLVDNGEAMRVLTRTPRSFGNPNSFNGGMSIVVLEDFEQRRPIGEIIGETVPKISNLPGIRAFPVQRSGLTRNLGEPVQFVIGGNTYSELKEWQDIVMEAARENPRLLNVDTDFKETKPQFRVRVDKERAADLGVSLRQIGQTLETFFGSRRVTTFLERGEEYDVILQGRDTDRQTATDLTNIYVRSEKTSTLIPLSNLIKLEETAEASTLNRFNRLRAVTITASLAEGYTLGEALEYLREIVREKLPPRAQVDYKGESREFIDSQGAIYFVFSLSLVMVFLVLAAQFESWVHPFTILLTVPLAIAGGLWGLIMYAGTLNIFSQIGIVMLVGLAAKNGILIVEFANQLRDEEGMSVREAVLRASQLRLRPIAMTAISTVFGAIPLVIATGAGSENRITIGVVIFFGVSIASVLTLFSVPWAYNLFGRFTTGPNARAQRIEAEAAQKSFQE
ncbi:efflux RND transporter permease subunit [Cerasicoccus arenae]|uniref:Multidrug transporter n=1 Tax=Cerasicoccus arenae TaxID=424488 RepID=A0A8J3DFI5_9BACT|nr:efflux RND transporter permease subunit [Cerasicoccus arenae]MBK1857182.1 efflux RND transporter permease subunit [Cerasicoccus arenae]GHB92824.1 multidrug transporter [Cerasicoccus arenae]